jgi:phytol kinase
VILLAVMVAAIGTLVEADSWRGFDNFFLPAGLMVFLESHMNSPWQDLIALIGMFMVAVVVFLRITPRFGITKHAARVYVISTFLLISVTALQNTVLPLLVFVMHAIAHRMNPCKAPYPALDIVAAVALASFGWLAIGLVAEANALMYYGLMSVGLCVSFGAIALGKQPVSVRLGAAAILGLGLFGLYSVLMIQNPAFVRWPGDMKLTGAVAIATMVFAGSLRPALFDTHRAAKLTILALLVPGIGYGIKVVGA